MPIYEYTCQSCHHHFEEIQKISDPVVMACPKCGKDASRQISQTSFSLKGEGWYKDGYAKPAKKDATTSTAPSAAPEKPVATTSKPPPSKGE
ncbi:MAG: FmdB family transcriptional regulator [Deltaproteobacteria bacterium CG11_big_fil_rev_8_21_14_0_20_47_16]|nr:MAG: FmdB family transcriptional regulator [Deltaproteobacteria bacterium CG11_big_fil_rev_8_21_14_0_20_47_16]